MDEDTAVLYQRMNYWRRVVIGLVLLLSGAGRAMAQSGGDAQHVTAKLLSDTASVQPDRPFQLGVFLQIDPGWHVYWSNPGDSGSPTRLTLHVPPGFTVEPVQYPVPLQLKAPGAVTNFGYENEVMLIARITPALQLMQEKRADLNIAVDVHYLVCSSDVCVPGAAKLAITLPTSSVAAPSPSANLLRDWEGRMPKPADSADVSGISCDTQLGESGNKARATVRLQWSVAVPHDIAFFPGPVKGFDLSEVKVVTTGLTTTCSYLLTSPENALLPPTLDTVVAFQPENQSRLGLAVPIPSINRQEMPPAVPPASP